MSSSGNISTSITNILKVTPEENLPKGYYRSKLFVTYSATNPLVNAASPLLSLLERLSLSPTLPPIDTIRDNIQHELLAFHSRLTSQKYAHELIKIAHYFLTATIDELLGKNYLRLYGKPTEFKAFTTFSHDTSRPEHRFFEIVQYIKQRTNQYLDLVELAYYCLITGFEGEHHFRADGRQLLDNLIEELHQVIQKHRAHKPARLFQEPIAPTSEPANHKPALIKLACALGLIIITYLGGDFLLDNKAKTLLFEQTKGTEWITH